MIGDWYSAEKHAWAASAEERAMDARGPAMRGSAAYHSHEVATKDHAWCTHPTRSAVGAALPGETAPTALPEQASPAPSRVSPR